MGRWLNVCVCSGLCGWLESLCDDAWKEMEWLCVCGDARFFVYVVG